MIVCIPVIPQNSVCVQIEFNDYLATAACFFGVDLAMLVQIPFFILFLAFRHLVRADIKVLLSPEQPPALNCGSDKLD